MHSILWLMLIALVSFQAEGTWFWGKKHKNPNRCTSSITTSWSKCRHKCGDITRRQLTAQCTDFGTNLAKCASICNIQDTTSYKQCYPSGCQPSHYCCPNQCSNPVENCQTMDCNPSQTPVCSMCKLYSQRGPEFSLAWPDGPNICNPTCSWFKHNCWPGTCGKGHLAKYCQCNQGFVLVKTKEATKCELEKGPKLFSCDFGVQNQYGDISNFTSSKGCHSEQDILINIVPVAISMKMESMLTLNITMPLMSHIVNFTMGVVSGSISMKKISHSGSTFSIGMVKLPEEGNCNGNFNQIFPSKSKVHCSRDLQLKNFTMKHGDRLCTSFSSNGGGYLTVKSQTTLPVTRQYYRPTASTETRCFQYDIEAPQHCSETSKCGFEPIKVISTLSSSANITIIFDGWFDGDIYNNRTKNNGVESYEVVVHPMTLAGDQLQVDQTKTLYKHKSFNETALEFILPDGAGSGLHALYLTVKDFAGNAQYARRFFLYDNSSLIEARNIPLPKVISKTGRSDIPWYSDQENICITWYNLFRNTFLETHLKPIKRDNTIPEEYEHTSGLLNINGTKNIQGIIQFTYQFQVNDGNISRENLVSSKNNQTQCFQNIVQDGDSLSIWVTAIDIMNHTLSKNITIFTDRSAPSTEEFSLTKDQHQQLYMHNSSDLSSMIVSLDAFDRHSGLKKIQWILGTKDGSNDIGMGSLPVVKLGNSVSCPPGIPCYCPSYGPCQMKNFTLTLNALIAKKTHKGQHNRRYFAAIRVENMAGLFNEEHLDIVLDESSPSTGSVKEGREAFPDLDFTGSENLTVNWEGFVDHESDIYYYVVGVASRCLTISELTSRCSLCNISNTIINTTRTSAQFSLRKTGKYFSTVIAYNYAMEPSNAACSDGVEYDKTPPKLKDVILAGAKTQETIACYNGKMWRINFDLTKKRLTTSESCFQNCTNFASNSILPILKERIRDTMLKTNICSTNFTPPSQNNLIGIPSDNVHLSWKYTEDESEILDFFVGISSSLQLKQHPDIVGYTSTIQKTRFQKHRLGVKPGDRFYIFIQSVNKAMNSETTVLGPIVYDQSPPVYNGGLNISLNNDIINIVWQNDSFYDPEENTDLLISYQIKNSLTGKAVTPWRNAPGHSLCSEGLPCIKLNIDKLGIAEPETSLSYFFELHIFNMAGLFTTITSPFFQLPMKHPFNHGRVIDLNPASKSNRLIHMHSTLNSACICLEDFHPSMDLLIGIGSNRFTADVVPFQPVTNRRRHCISNPGIRSFQKYFTIVNMTLQTQTRLVASDGFIIIDQQKIKKQMSIFNGQNGCSHNESIKISFHYNTSTKTFVAEFLQDAVVGHLYMIGFKETAGHFNMSSDMVKTMPYQSVHFNNTMYRSFIALNPRPTLHIAFRSGLSNRNKIPQPILRLCPISVNVQTSKHQMTANWEIKGPYSQYVTHFKLSLVDRMCLNNGGKICSVMNPHHLKKVFHVIQRNLNLISGHKYSFSIQACAGEAGCTESVLSAGAIVLDKNPIKGKFQAHLLTSGNGSLIKVDWESFLCISGNYVTEPIVFQLNAFYKNQSLLHPARFIMNPKNQKVFKDQIIFNHTLEGTETITLTTYCLSGLSTETKVPLLVNSQTNNTNLEICEFRADFATSFGLLSVTDHKVISQFCSHNETDFISYINDKVGAIVTKPNIIVSDWYLMSVAEPPEDQCSSTINCLKTLRRTMKSIIFDIKNLSPNKIYYICAKGEKILTPDIFQPYGSCGDGFLVDGNPPLAGKVIVDNSYNGFLTTSENIIFHWDGFNDKNTEFINPFYPQIASYSYSAGSYPGTQDIVAPVDVGVTSQAVCEMSPVQDGQQIFVTVTAYDMSGLIVNAISEAIIVDTSPPLNGTLNIGSATSHSYYIDTNELTIYWTGITDKESGIISKMFGIGTLPLQDDVVAFSEQFKEFSEIQDKSLLQDGHRYYGTLKVTNGAGLESTTVTEAFITDVSPPIEGIVMEVSTTEKGDIEYQRDISKLEAQWFGFTDPHTGILFYRAGVGTAPLRDDVIRMTNMGQKTGHYWKRSYIPGIKYYVTVEACNKAFLCSRSTSNGVIMDNSPPLTGIVEVGTDAYHHTYQAHQSTLNIQWTGFYDPHSSMKKFEYCIGKMPFTCDMLQWQPALLTTSVVALNLNLPLKTLLYSTVKGYNNVGLTSIGSSAGFYIDKTSPIALMPPKVLNLEKLTTNGNNVLYTTDNSVLSVEWSFEDNESPIVDHLLMLYPHHSGTTFSKEFQLPPMKHATLVLKEEDRLQDGSLYNITMAACNAAGLCTFVDALQQIYVDSSAPSMGHFKPDKLNWDTVSEKGNNYTRLNLTWYNFEDGDSGINRYHLIIRHLNNQLLCNPIIVPHRSGMKYQSTSTTLNKLLTPPDQLIIEILAENGVGLYSEVFKLTVEMLSSSKQKDYGLLEIQKHSCSVQYCNNDCTCAASGKKCQVMSKATTKCQSLPKENTSLSIDVLNNKGFIVSSKCLTAHWKVSNSSAVVQRFEWSAGIKGSSVGDGIFNILEENPWRDIGLQDHVSYCLPKGQNLQSSEEYVFYIKAWYSADQFRVFTSTETIKLDLSAPVVRRGASVRDTIKGCDEKEDIDYMTKVTTIAACWKGVFTEKQSVLTYFIVMAGTEPGYGDLLPAEILPANITEKVSRIKLEKGSSYYFTVVAVNNLGLFVSLSSDGFVFDDISPLAGIVYNTENYRNTYHQNLQKFFGISWHGFEDAHSAVYEYLVAMGPSNLSNATSPFTSVGIATSHKFEGPTLDHNKCYVGYVQAVDAAGHRSPISRSPEVCIDRTPAEGYKCESTKNIIQTEFEINKNNLLQGQDQLFIAPLHLQLHKIYYIYFTIPFYKYRQNIVLYIGDYSVRIPPQVISDTTHFKFHFTSRENGRKNVSLEFTTNRDLPPKLQISLDECISVSSDKNSALELWQTSPTELLLSLQVVDRESDIKHIYVGAGTTPLGFQINQLSQVSPTSIHTIYSESLPHAQQIYVTVQVENEAGIIATFTESLTTDNTPPDISFVHFIISHSELTEILVEAKWKSEDKESGISKCYYSIGTDEDYTAFVEKTEVSASNKISKVLSAKSIESKSLIMYVNCINNAGLALGLISRPTTVPKHNNTKVHMIPINEWSHTNSCCVQSDRSQLRIIIEHAEEKRDDYMCKITENGHVYMNWVSIGYHRQLTYRELNLKDGSTYQAEIKGNHTMKETETSQSNRVVVDSTWPELTGSLASLKRLSESSLEISWEQVFKRNNHQRNTYMVNIGSQEGSSDIVHRVETDETSLVFQVKSEIKTFYVSIMATFETGLSNIFATTLHMI